MIDYSDLLNVPYKVHGRDKNGFDCYGLVIECAKRNKTPLVDIFSSCKNNYIIEGINLEKIDRPEANCVVETLRDGFNHIGYLIARDLVLHCTSKGVKTIPLSLFNPTSFYRIVEK